MPKTDAAALAEAPAPSGGDDFAAVFKRLARPLRVLLAEDNGTNQLVFSKLVQGFRHRPHHRGRRPRGARAGQAGTFDIVFMDMRMPEMDGLEATRAIRALGGAWSDIPIVALTANAFPEDVKECRDAGMNDFIAKPIRKKVLLERMAAMLADHPLLRAARDSSAAVRRRPCAAPPGARQRPFSRTPSRRADRGDGRGGVRAMFDDVRRRDRTGGSISCAGCPASATAHASRTRRTP